MNDIDTATKANDQMVATGGDTKTTDQSVSTDTVALLEKLRKAESDRDNYRAGMLKYKGKSKDDEDFNMEEFIAMKVQEELANQTVKVTEEEFKRALKDRDEAFTALKNRSQISTIPEGTSTEDTTKVSDGILSNDKINQFKKMGWSDEKIEVYKKNLMKNRGFN